jgi:transcriptional regulator with XRE-family HTH domain
MSLSPQQIRAAELLAQGKSQQDVATSMGVNRKTIQRWLQKEDFKNLSFGLVNRSPRLQDTPKPQSEKNLPCTNLTPQDLIQEALIAVRDILQNPDSRNSDKLKAATLLGSWAGLTSDFNVALTSLRRYGLVLCESDDGSWILHDQREKQIFDE